MGKELNENVTHQNQQSKKAVEKSSLDPKLNTRIHLNMVLMLAGKFVSLFGSFFYSFAIGLYVLKVTGSGMSFAVTLIFGMLPRIIVGPFAGTIADRIDRKKMVVGMDFFCGIIVLGFWIISEFYGLKLLYIYITALLLSTCNSFFSVALDASIPNLVDNSRLMRINSLNQSITSLTQIMGPMIGGFIYAFIDIKFFLIINGVSFILSGISEIFIDFNLMADKEQVSDSKKALRVKEILKDLQEGFVYLKKKEILFVLFSFSIFLNFFFNMGMSVPYPYIINNVVKLSPEQFGVIQSIFSVGLLLGSVILSVLPEFEKKFKILLYGLLGMTSLLILCGIPAIPTVMAIGKTPIFIFYIIIGFLMGLINVIMNIPVMVMLQRETPDQYRGRVFGVIQTMTMGIVPLSYIIAGLLIENMPPYLLPIGSGICLLFLSSKIATNRALKQF